VALWTLCAAGADAAESPAIRKLGTIDVGLVEATPLVFRDRLYRFEYVRAGYYENKTGESYFRFIDIESGGAATPFAATYDLGCAFVDSDATWVFGVNNWDGDTIAGFRSSDLERWDAFTALKLPGWGVFNTSVCKAQDRYVLAIEVGKPPEVVGVPFTIRFAESNDLRHWTLLSEDRVFTKGRYSACPSIRFLDGRYYMTYLEAKAARRYETYIVRSADLAHWESSPLNPVLRASPEDKRVANPKLSADQRKEIAQATDVNNSDLDFCEFQGRTILTYSWGNQQGTEFLAEAVYDGSLASFLRAFFP
jgi:hypothetical protein